MEPQRANILLVDDEPALTRLMQTYLSRLGYTIDTSLKASEALELFERDPSRYQLLITDQTLPDIPGQEMALMMIARNPSLRVLLCSGYPLTVESLPSSLQNRARFLQKPFLPNQLADSVEDLLKLKIE